VPTQPPLRWIPGLLFLVQGHRARSWPLTVIWCRECRCTTISPCSFINTNGYVSARSCKNSVHN
jgi:hypothetical protein